MNNQTSHHNQPGLLFLSRQTAGLTLLLCTLSTAAFSDSGSGYFGASFGQSYVEPDRAETRVDTADDSNSGIKLTVGKTITDQLSIEAFWAGLGKAKLTNGAEVGYSHYGAVGLFKYPGYRSNLSVFGKAGIAGIEIDSDIGANIDEDPGLFSGVGAEWRWRDGLSLRAEYDYFTKDSRLLSIGVLKRYGDTEKTKRITVIPGTRHSQGNQSSLATVEAKQTVGRKVAPIHDLDLDGIPNNLDKCHQTPRNAASNSEGCPVFLGKVPGVVFSRDAANLNISARKTLDSIAREMKKYSRQEFVIIGNAFDSRNKRNVSLTRARNVANYLVTRGVSKEIIRFGMIKNSKKQDQSTNGTKPGQIVIFLSRYK